MTAITNIATQVRQHWLERHLNVQPVAMKELVDAWRSLPGVLPEEYEAFLRIAGLPTDEDAQGFRFWLPGELRATADVLRDAGYGCNATEASVIFVDYFQQSWWYALWVSGPWKGYVSLVLGTKSGNDPRFPLGSLEEFLLAYIKDDEEFLCRGMPKIGEER
ncbi:hypothetical protein HUA74_39760 [Myxococcus sp. CA051A]|uniref:hypothetical protein n=1 Tax=Myxococcus sp. CA051A TaxID=2741739 RepID=UPI00157A7259|nr:hypothetical protein [Myxococcus sp. CA051A]NTX66804.1 hypothetical protein [Myxococcus sp. CA051A]